MNICELDYSFIYPIALIKAMHDYGVGGKLLNLWGRSEVSSDDRYEIAYDASESAFENLCIYYNEYKEVETWVFFDPLIDEFCRLCEEYERKKNIPHPQNPYRRDIETAMRSALCFNSYSYDYNFYMYPEQIGRHRLALILYNEFCDTESIPLGLLEFRAALEHYLELLRKELRPLVLLTTECETEVKVAA
jgi:hypothetical protein